MNRLTLPTKLLFQRSMAAFSRMAVFLLGATLAIGLLFSQLSLLPAQAGTLTPEAKAYQVNQGKEMPASVERVKDQTKSAEGGVAKSLKNAAAEVREKLNLDEPLPESTRDFIKQVQGEDVKVEEPRPFGK